MNTYQNAQSDQPISQKIMSLVQNLSEEKKQLLLDLLVEWQQKELRSDSRMPCLVAVDFATKKRSYRDFMHDLSKGGVFIETRETFSIGDKVSMTFSMPDNQNHFKISGNIVRSEGNGIGVQFDTKLSSQQEEVIKASIK